MDSDTIRKQKFITNFVYLAIGFAIYFVFFKYIIYKIWPFAIGAFLALVLSGPATKLAAKLHLPRKGVAIVLVTLALALAGGLIGAAVTRIIYLLSMLFADLPRWYNDNLAPVIQNVMDWYENFSVKLNPEVSVYLNDIQATVMSKLLEAVTLISKKALSFTQSVVTGIPGMIIGIIFCLVSVFIMTIDSETITHFLMAQFSEKTQKAIKSSLLYLRRGLWQIVRSYGLIMCITGCELFIGFKIIGISSPGAKAILIAIFDIMPALGTGGIVLPWVVVKLIQGELGTGFELFVLYLIITVVRNFIEPHIVGDSIGVHPVLLLLSIFAGAAFLGPLGIVILPFTLIVIRNLNDSGQISLYKSDYLANKRSQRRERREEKRENRRTERQKGSPYL